jgi:LacI family xylobiose transport system transcriptional regulator
MSGDIVERGSMTRATLSRVADDADVSISTVSKVLNGRAGVSDATRRRVEELLRDHGYNRRNTPLTVAPLIELVFHEVDSPWSIDIIAGVERAAREHGLSMLITVSGDRHKPSPDWIEGAMRRRPTGVILVFSDLSADHKHQLRARNIPFVVVDPSGDPAADVPSIGTANWSGGYAATKHLLELGHRDVAIVAGPEDMLCSTARLSGYRAALDSAGIEVRQEYIAPSSEFRFEDGLRGAGAMLDLPHPPTAIFASSDLQALGVYEAARRRGLRIPEDLSVVGYDDVDVASWAGPPLTTVRQPLTEMAGEAVRLIVRLRDGARVDHLHVDLESRLVVRESTRAPA